MLSTNRHNALQFVQPKRACYTELSRVPGDVSEVANLCCEHAFRATLQDGADERDKVQEEVCSMLLEYADELEQEEREMAARQAAWEAETKRLAAEQAAFEAEQARIAAQQAQARHVAEEAAK